MSRSKRFRDRWRERDPVGYAAWDRANNARSRAKARPLMAARAAYHRSVGQGWRAPEGWTPGQVVAATVPFYAKSQRLTEETGVRHEVDHRTPVKAGGTHLPTNLRVVTMRTNREKIGNDMRLIREMKVAA